MDHEETYIQFYDRDEATTLIEIATELQLKFERNLTFNYITKIDQYCGKMLIILYHL